MNYLMIIYLHNNNEKEVLIMKRLILSIMVLLLIPPGVLFAQVENWIYMYNGSDDNDDFAKSIIYGDDGNVYAAGRSEGIGTSSDFMVISLDTAGDTNWTYTYNGSGNEHDLANSITYGDDGNLYAAGYTTGTTNRDFTVISLDTAGDTNWTYTYNGSGNSVDEANSIIYGDDGNVYAAGYSSSGAINKDFMVISLDTDGDTNWTYIYDGPVNYSDDQAKSIVYGTDGNIYAAGYREATSGTNYDFTVISLDTLGNVNWLYIYNGPANTSDQANSIIYGDDGNLYAAGHSGGVTNTDFFVMSFNPSTEDTNWTYFYNGPGNSRDEANSIIYGDDGNLYAAGYSTGSGTQKDFAVISLDTAGDANWTYTYNGSGNEDDGANSIIYGDDGNLYAVGNSRGSGIGFDFTVIWLDTLSNVNGIYIYNGSGNEDDGATSIVYGDDGNLYAAGYTTGTTNSDFTVISFIPCVCDVAPVSIDIDTLLAEGTTLSPQATVTNFGINTETFSVTCLINPSDPPYNSTVPDVDLAAGDSLQVTFSPDFTFESGSYTVTIYTQLVDDERPENDTLEEVIATYDPGIVEESTDTPKVFSFSVATISNGRDNIVFALPEATKADLLVYDVLGRLSKTLISQKFSAGTHNIPVELDLPAGVYFYNLKTESGRNVVKKFLLIE
jgi:YD repeat-containing protein